MIAEEQVSLPRGEVSLVLTDENGIIVDQRHVNLIVDQMRDAIAAFAAQVFTDKIDKIAIGDGGHEPGDPNTPVPPTVSDTALDNQLVIKTVTSVSQPDVKSAQFSFGFTTADVSDPTSVTEAGLFTDPAGDLVARVTFPELIITGILTLTVTWKLIF